MKKKKDIKINQEAMEQWVHAVNLDDPFWKRITIKINGSTYKIDRVKLETIIQELSAE